MSSHRQRGNILFLILLAVVLFAALTYAVNSGMRGGGNSAGKESAQAGASAIIQYMTLVKTEINRLRMVNGCNWDNIDFRSTTFKRADGSNMYNNAPISPKAGCALFSEYGGGVAAQIFEKYEAKGFKEYVSVNDTGNWMPGHPVFRWASRINEGTDASDVIMLMGGIAPDVCAYVSNMTSPPSPVPVDPWDYGTTMGNQPPVITGTDRIGDDPSNLYGETFVHLTSTASATIPYCRIGMIMISR